MIGIGLGIDWSTNKNLGFNALSLITAFKARVFADTGTYSAEACQLATLTILNNIP